MIEVKDRTFLGAQKKIFFCQKLHTLCLCKTELAQTRVRSADDVVHGGRDGDGGGGELRLEVPRTFGLRDVTRGALALHLRCNVSAPWPHQKLERRLMAQFC